MIFFRKIILLLLLMLQLQSCEQNKVNKKAYLINNNFNNKWVGKNIVYPKTILALQPEHLAKEDTGKSKFEIIIYYDGNCSMCYLELLKWNKIIKNFKELNLDVSFKFILSGYNSALLKSNLDNIKFPINQVYYDIENEFGKKYSFLLEASYTYSSILLDNNNKVLRIGNPTNSKNEKDIFIELMKD